MNLVAPAALGLLVLCAPVILFFLRRPPVPTRAISSLLLARALAHIPQRRRRLPREEFVPLALILCALVTLVIAVAFRPTESARRIIVLLDDSETSPLHDPTTATASTTEVKRLLRARPEAAVTVVGTAPLRIRIDQVTDKRQVLAALQPAPATQPGDDPSLLLEQLCAQGPATVVMLGTWPLLELPTGCEPVQPKLPLPETDILTAVTATAPTSTGDVWLHVQAAGEQTTAVVEHQGTVIGTVELSDAEVREGLARVSTPPGQPITVRLEGGDHATATSTIDIPPLVPARTLVRTEHPNGYLATLARVHPRLRGVVLAPDAPAPTPDTASGAWDLVLTDSAAPINDRGTVVAVFGRAAPELGVRAGSPTRLPAVTVSAPDAPMLQLVSLSTLHIEQAITLKAPADAKILAACARGPLALERPLSASSRAVVFGFGLDDTDLALRSDFVHLIANLVDEAAPAPPPPTPGPQRRARPATAGLATTAPTRAQPWSWLVALALALLTIEGLWLAIRSAPGRRR